MDTLATKVNKVLKQAFPRPAKIYLRPQPDGIIGIVASKRFLGMEMSKRADILDDVLDKALDADEKKKIAIIVPMTHEEADAHPELTGAGRNSR